MTDVLDPAVLAVRPQPLGAFPLPLGYLLIPASPDTEDARVALLSGRLPDWPDSLRAHELALAGDRDGALAALPGDDPITRYNRVVRDPDGDRAVLVHEVLGDGFRAGVHAAFWDDEHKALRIPLAPPEPSKQ